MAAVRAKLDDYFARCRLAAFDSRAVVALAPGESDLAALAGKSLTNEAAEIAQLRLPPSEPSVPCRSSKG